MVRHHTLLVPKRMQVQDITLTVHKNSVCIIERISEDLKEQKVENSDLSLADATVKLKTSPGGALLLSCFLTAASAPYLNRRQP